MIGDLETKGPLICSRYQFLQLVVLQYMPVSQAVWPVLGTRYIRVYTSAS